MDYEHKHNKHNIKAMLNFLDEIKDYLGIEETAELYGDINRLAYKYRLSKKDRDKYIFQVKEIEDKSV